jgi:drug/metabolite transporter (DMT)-like permease
MSALPALWPGGALGIGSALLFGAATPLAKILLGAVEPWLLAGLLYLGAGLGLAGYRLAVGMRGEALLAGSDVPWLAGAIVSGGVLAPVLLVMGLARTSASTTSLLLTLEGALTALLAWAVFREALGARIVLGMAAIVAGAAVLAWQGRPGLEELVGPLLIALACLGWAVDNNLTRKVSGGDPVTIAMAKGLLAGIVNLAIALGRGAELPEPGPLAGAALTGLFGYGVSLVLFILALRHIGAARTGAYFSTAPFVGALLAVPLLGEPVTAQLLAGGALMATGVWLHLSERHDHEHAHEPMAHAHRHVHDAHHRHAHAPTDPPGESHTHWHVHARLRHKHPHFPDLHHTHSH